MSYPKISIVIPSFNQGGYIEETIKSIINQNYKNYELIIIDGDSTDDSLKIIKKYEKEIAFWISESDNGQSDAIQKGFNKAEGEIFAWQNSDDIYEPGAFSYIAKIFMENPNVDIVFGGWNVIDHLGRIYSTRKLNRFSVLKMQAGLKVPPQPAVFFKKAAIEKVGGIDISKKYTMDYDLYIRIVNKKNIHLTSHVLGSFRIHQASKTFQSHERFMKELSESRNLYCNNSLSHKVYFFFIDLYKMLIRKIQKKFNLFSFRDKIYLNNEL